MHVGLVILLGLALVAALYSALLQHIHERYVPDHIWVTVVVGNAIVGGAFALWLALDPLPSSHSEPFAAFWRLLGCNIAAGVPVIVWQLGQNAARAIQRSTNPTKDL